MSDALTIRARGCLVGLSLGDALGAPTEGKSQREIMRHWGRVTDFLSEDQSGSDDTEYALFNARLLMQHGRALTSEVIARHWKDEIAGSANSFKGAGFSEMLAIRNLRSGLLPPRSGYHLHAWSDGVAMRVAPFGVVFPGCPDRAATLAECDGVVTHSGEGVLAAKAVAAAVAQAMVGSPLDAILAAALQAVSVDSWTWRAISTGVTIGSAAEDVWSALPPLAAALVHDVYFWPDLAPEAVSLAFGVLAAGRGHFCDTILGAVNIGRDTDTIAAIAGAVVGAQQGETAIPEKWRRRITTVRGNCLRLVENMDIREVADRLAQIGRTSETDT